MLDTPDTNAGMERVVMDSLEIRATGCGQAAVIFAMLVWLGCVPPGVMFVLDSLPDGTVEPGVVAAIVIVLVGGLLLLPFIGVALLTRRRYGWEAAGAVSVGLVLAAGYILLDALVRAVAPTGTTAFYGEGAWAGLLRLGLLLPYALLATWLAPRLAGLPRRPLGEWLGLDRLDLPTLLIALTVAGLVTMSWPVTGALGDGLTSLSLIFQTLTSVIPQVLIFWGVIFVLLNSAFPRPWTAALVMVAIYQMSILGGILPAAEWGALWSAVLLFPLAFLLTELRAREGGVYSLILMFFCYRVMPQLFTDPRDILVQGGIPELQHLLSYAIVLLITIVAAFVLFVVRRLLLSLRDRLLVPNWVRLVSAAGAALFVWSIWGGLYVFAGNPGFVNDGFLIILEEQADLSAAYAIPDREDRLHMVYQMLVETAERTQAPLRAELDELGVSYRPYYIINMIRIDGHRWLKGRFEGKPGVAQVIMNPNVREYPYTIPLSSDLGGEPGTGVQPNLAAIHADAAWALGVMGEGIVVGGQDTGYDWTHPALKAHYRGWDGQRADHDYNWHDAWDDTAVPFDDHSHGTHTMGTVLGDDGGSNRTGVAPGAQWIGCRNMQRGFGNPGSYAECMEFFIAPYPHGGDPFADGDVSIAPHVVSNSWGCPYWEGCSADTLESAFEAMRAAGIMMVVAVGNEGPACSTADMPPANSDATFSVGATTDGGSVVGFSSRGPVDGLIKPDVTAPGESVRSSVPGGDYASFPGTSMATPHVAGLVALLWSADPTLIGDIDATEALICQTARPRPVDNVCTAEDQVGEGMFAALTSNPVCACGGVTGVPNNIYGCGFIDAGAAVQAALEQ
jgi:hypothetical protein